MGKARGIARRVILAATLASLLAPSQVAAAGSCGVTLSGDLQFGAYNPFAHEHRDSIARVRVDCPKGVAPQIAISKGNSPTYAMRELRSGRDVLRYNLYLDPSHQLVWGDGTEGSRPFQPPTGNAQATIYARIPAGQDVAGGVYSDTLVITIFL